MDERQAVRVFQHRLEQAATGGVDNFLNSMIDGFWELCESTNGKL